MALVSPSHAVFPARQFSCNQNPDPQLSRRLVPGPCSRVGQRSEDGRRKRPLTVVAAAGDVSADGTTYLIAGAAAVALLGTAFPVLFSRKDL